ncbi:MAG TPA: FAD-binding oxidoreductase [Alphaproteobacteria bacterium]|nr:FAD-binding oxidoreductase [Alphaproteobacteria bacterium]
MAADIFAPGFKEEPYWWEAVPRLNEAEEPLPQSADVVVIGSGFAGLNCAIETARAARSTVVLEQQALGYGASTRLAGYIGRFMHFSYQRLEKKFGPERAKRMWSESGDAQRVLLERIEHEQMEVGKLWRGRFTGACAPAHYENLARNAEYIAKRVPFKFEMCPKSEQRSEVGTDFWHGGMILIEHGTLHPGKYHQGLIDAARRAGAGLYGHTPVVGVRPKRKGYTVATARGAIEARDVVICTNGYTPDVWSALPWVRRRIVPVPAYQICTAEMPIELMRSVTPKGRAMLDSKENIYWCRPTPDDKRLIFGARTGHDDGEIKITAQTLYDILTGEVFPQLKGVTLSHVWKGVMGFSFDKLPHMGQTRDGVYFATGFCGSGLPLGTYFGKTVGNRLLGRKEGESAFWNIGFPTWPFYNGKPWWLRLYVAWVDYRDRRGLQGHITRGG